MMMKSVKQLSDILALLIWIRKLIGRPTLLQTFLTENGTMGKRGFFHLVYPRNVIPVITGDNGGNKLNNCCSQEKKARP